jgi:RNase P subunit RPR2
MDRFDILLNKPKEVLKTIYKVKDQEVKNKVVVLKEWPDKFLSISLEKSPKKAYCHTCLKIIEPKTGRYAVNEKRVKYFSKYCYHLKCLPLRERKIVMDFPKRDFVFEATLKSEKCIEAVVSTLPQKDQKRYYSALETWAKMKGQACR